MVLSLFDSSNKIRDAFRSRNIQAYSLDIHPGYKGSKVDLICDILDFEYHTYLPGHFKFLFIALPCQAYSIASGAKHFKQNVPVTSTGIKAINILIKIYQITKYFQCPFLIENPSGGLINNAFFKSFFDTQVTRLPMSHFGFKTTKKTDLFYNFNMLLMVPRAYRCNNRYSRFKLDSLSYRQRVTYPDAFCSWIVENIIFNLNLNTVIIS